MCGVFVDNDMNENHDGDVYGSLSTIIIIVLIDFQQVVSTSVS